MKPKKNKIVRPDENGTVDLRQFDEFIDISRIEYYETIKENGKIVVKFYDKDKNLIKPFVS